MKISRGTIVSYSVTTTAYGIYGNFKIMELIPPMQSYYNVKGKCEEKDATVSFYNFLLRIFRYYSNLVHNITLEYYISIYIL